MHDQPRKPAVAVDPEMAIELRNWLVTVAQRLGYEPATVAEIRTPPTTTAPETIAPVVGDIAVMIDGAFLADPETVRVRLERDVEPIADSDPPPSSPYRPAVLDDRDTAGAADAGAPAYDLGGHANDEPLGDVPDIDAFGPPEADPRPDTTPHNVSLPEEVWQHVPTRTDSP